MFETIREILLRYIETEGVSITEDTRLQEDLFLNSLDFIYIIMDLEERHGVAFSDEEIGSMRTVGDLQEQLIGKTQA